MILLLLMIVRVWFDMAQVIAVAEDEKKMHRALRRAFGLLRRNFFSLFWLYLRVSIIAWALFAFGLHVWMYHLKPQSTVAAFLVSQLMILRGSARACGNERARPSGIEMIRRIRSPEPAWTPAPAPVFASVAADPQP